MLLQVQDISMESDIVLNKFVNWPLGLRTWATYLILTNPVPRYLHKLQPQCLR